MLDSSKVLFRGNLTGTTFQPSKDNLLKSHSTNNINDWYLEHIKDNQYDEYALAVKNKNGEQVGWVPKGINKGIIDYGLDKVKCYFLGFNMRYDGVVAGADIIIRDEAAYGIKSV